METKVTSHIIKGLLIALIIIVINVIGQLTKLYLENWFGWIGLVLFIGLVLWATIYFGQQMNGQVTFGNLFAHGFKTTAVATCIIFVYTVLAVYVLFPDFIDEMLDKGLAEARKKGTATEEQIQQGMVMGKKILTISILAGSLIIDLVLGVIGALIGAAIAKKNPAPSPFEQ